MKPTDVQGNSGGEKERSNAYVAIVLGPTVGAPKARVILSLEGLEVKVWGVREEEPLAQGPRISRDEVEAEGAEDERRATAEEGEDEADSDDEPLPSDSEDEDSEVDDSSEDESIEPTYAAQQAFLDAQTRLLSRRLAEANASEDGGLSSEMGELQGLQLPSHMFSAFY